jgi:hypothetical protein
VSTVILVDTWEDRALFEPRARLLGRLWTAHNAAITAHAEPRTVVAGVHRRKPARPAGNEEVAKGGAA